jgi:hypothetical protein
LRTSSVLENEEEIRRRSGPDELRLSAMNLDRIKTIFMEAAALDASPRRSAYLDSICVGDAALPKEVENPLAAHFLQRPILDSPENFPSSPAIRRFRELLGGKQNISSKICEHLPFYKMKKKSGAAVDLMNSGYQR